MFYNWYNKDHGVYSPDFGDGAYKLFLILASAPQLV